MITTEQFQKYTTRIQKLKGYLEIDKKLILIKNEEEKSANPEFWNNPKEAEVVLKNLRTLKKWVEDYNQLRSLEDDLSVLLEF